MEMQLRVIMKGGKESSPIKFIGVQSHYPMIPSNTHQPRYSNTVMVYICAPTNNENSQFIKSAFSVLLYMQKYTVHVCPSKQ